MGLAQRNLVIIFPGTVQRPTSSTSRLRLLFYVDTVVIARLARRRFWWAVDAHKSLIIGKRNKNRTKVATINVRYDVDDGPRNINYINDCIQSGILNRSKIDFQSPSLPSSSPVLIDLRSGVRQSKYVVALGKATTNQTTSTDISIQISAIHGTRTGKSISEQHPLDLHRLILVSSLTAAIAFRDQSTV